MSLSQQRITTQKLWVCKFALKTLFCYEDCYTKIICPVDDDLIFMDTNFTLSVGNRICFDAIIIDDDAIEIRQKYHSFQVRLQNRIYHHHFGDYTRIGVRDNEGWFSVIKILLPHVTKIAGAHIIIGLTLFACPGQISMPDQTCLVYTRYMSTLCYYKLW